MKIISRSIVAALLVTAAGGLVSAPAFAKEAEKASAPSIKLSKPVQAPLAAAQKAQQAGDNPGALAKIREAEAFPTPTADDSYMINAMKINVAIATKDNTLLEEALTKALATGKVSATDHPKFLRNIGALALQRKDYAAATNAFEALVKLTPNDADSVVALAELYQSQKQSAKAVATLTQAIAASKANGQVAPEPWYRRALAIAYDGKMANAQQTATALVQAYPNAVNWRDALVISRETMKLDDQGSLDFMRLQAAAGALNGERDYAEYADTALSKGFPGEAKTVLEEGVRKGMLNASKPYIAELTKAANSKIAADKAALPGLEKEAKTNPKTALSTADAYFGYADYAKAATLYRSAAASPTVDADTANLRLGAALARAGDKDAAATAFNAVKAGPRATLAKYWLIWIGKAA